MELINGMVRLIIHFVLDAQKADEDEKRAILDELVDILQDTVEN